MGRAESSPVPERRGLNEPASHGGQHYGPTLAPAHRFQVRGASDQKQRPLGALVFSHRHSVASGAGSGPEGQSERGSDLALLLGLRSRGEACRGPQAGPW